MNANTASKPRWYHVTPDRFFIGLLAVQVFLLLSEQFQWFWFNENKGWTVLIAVGVVLVAVMVMLVWGLVCLLLRRRFQFGVRSLLVFLVAVSVPLGWFAWELRRARRQREAVKAIVGMDGTVTYGYELDETWVRFNGVQPRGPARLRQLLGDDFFCEVKGVNCDYYTEFGDDDAKHLQELKNLHGLSLDNTEITDNGLVHLKKTTQLEWLSLNYTQITNDGIGHLAGTTKLEQLSVDGTHISDNGLAHLKQLTRLEALSLDGTHITDDGLTHLQRMTKLERLSLAGTQVTDDGLEYLRKLTRLKTLNLHSTRVTHEGMTKLREAIPNCLIVPLTTTSP